MAYLSLRSIPSDLKHLIETEIKKSNKTKTQIVIDALKLMFSLTPKDARRKKIRDFFHKAHKLDSKSFNESIKHFSKIDKELWK